MRDNKSFSRDNISFSRDRWTTGVVLPSQKGGGDKNVKETLEVFRDVFSRASAPKVVLRV